jgi:hypothetical protein
MRTPERAGEALEIGDILACAEKVTKRSCGYCRGAKYPLRARSDKSFFKALISMVR